MQTTFRIHVFNILEQQTIICINIQFVSISITVCLLHVQRTRLQKERQNEQNKALFFCSDRVHSELLPMTPSTPMRLALWRSTEKRTTDDCIQTVYLQIPSVQYARVSTMYFFSINNTLFSCFLFFISIANYSTSDRE